ncbi:MAG: PorT family protein [Flavobacterium sp.]|nr:PorT family protein [Pedobacter sp.]
MKEQIDYKIVNRIKQVFDQYEDSTANAGWIELRKSYPTRNRRPIILWLSTIAAVIFLATGLWVAYSYQQNKEIKPSMKDRVLAEKKMPVISDPQKNKTNKIVITKSQEIKLKTQNGYVKKVIKLNTTLSKSILPDVTSHPGNPKTKDSLGYENLPVDKLSESILNAQKAAIRIDADNFAVVAIYPVKMKTNNAVFVPALQNPDPKKDLKTNKNKPLALTVFAGSYFNYAEGSEDLLNFGAGFLSDIRISKNLKLSTGVSLASNRLSYNQKIPLATSDYRSLKQLNSSNLTSISNYNASLLALDIPLNLKLQFFPESDKVYVSAGLISGTYLNETYSFQYRYFSPASGSYASRIMNQKSNKKFNDFDLGRTLNLAVGFSTRFGKTQTVSFEPFLKYPLGGLGSENIKFGSTGLNLKFHFQSANK